jgi:hypothetical protein
MVPNGMARRTCNPVTAEWDPVSLDECFTSEFVPSVMNYTKFTLIYTINVQLL